MAVALFWFAIVLLFYAYAGYPLLIWSPARRLLPRPVPMPHPIGTTYLLIPAHNEETVIAARLANAAAVAPDGMVIVVISDGSTDGTDRATAEATSRDARVRLIRVDPRQGKNRALGAALRQLSPQPDDVLVFTDANAMFGPGAIERLRDHIEAGAACVAGRLEFVDATTGTARAEGLYWRYENMVKRAEGAMGRLSVTNGAIFAARARDVPTLPPHVGNDFWIPIMALGEGKPVVFESAAVAYEPAPERSREEFQRKVRMANRQMRGVMDAWRRLDSVTQFQLVSHKVLRWLGIPIMLLVLMTGSMLWSEHVVYRSVAIGLSSIFALTVIAACARVLRIRLRAADLITHFFLVHAAALLGVLEALTGRRRTTWDLARTARRAVE